jgi:hypothetical protein
VSISSQRRMTRVLPSTASSSALGLYEQHIRKNYIFTAALQSNLKEK